MGLKISWPERRQSCSAVNPVQDALWNYTQERFLLRKAWSKELIFPINQNPSPGKNLIFCFLQPQITKTRDLLKSDCECWRSKPHARIVGGKSLTKQNVLTKNICSHCKKAFLKTNSKRWFKPKFNLLFLLPSSPPIRNLFSHTCKQ